MISLEGDQCDDEGLYRFERGHWIWDYKKGQLDFLKDPVEDGESSENLQDTIVDVVFDEDIDVLEQQRYLRKYGRRVGAGEEGDPVTLQDVKDLVLYTSPSKMLTKRLVLVLHTASYDRFARALIVYMQYFLQLCHALRIRSFEIKIRLPKSDTLESTWKKNLADMRAIMAKEYFRLMFDEKAIKTKHTNLIDAEIKFTEALLRLTTQIVWIALNRTDFDMIAVEIGGLFRSDRFNTALRRTDPKKSPLLEFRDSLVASQKSSKLYRKISVYNSKNPVGEAVLSSELDHKLMCVGVIGFESDDGRMNYLERYFCAPEEKFHELDVEVGILGRPRSGYDPMLRPVVQAKGGKGGTATTGSFATRQTSSRGSSLKFNRATNLYKLMDVPNPKKCEIPATMPNTPPKFPPKRPDLEQRRKWLEVLRTKQRRRLSSVVVEV